MEGAYDLILSNSLIQSHSLTKEKHSFRLFTWVIFVDNDLTYTSPSSPHLLFFFSHPNPLISHPKNSATLKRCYGHPKHLLICLSMWCWWVSFSYIRGVTGWRKELEISREQKKESLFVKSSSFIPICKLGFVGLAEWD